MKRHDFGGILKNRQMFFSGVTGLLLSIGVQISAQLFGISNGPQIGLTNRAHVEVY
jgi:hypothetical protein